MTWLRKSSPSNCHSRQHAILHSFCSSVNSLGTIFAYTFFIPKFCVRMLCIDDSGKPSSPAIMQTSFLQSSLTAANTDTMFSLVQTVEGWSLRGLSSQLSRPSLKRFIHLRMVKLFMALCPFTCLIWFRSSEHFFRVLLRIWHSFAAQLRHSFPWHRGCLHVTQHHFT